MSAAAETAVETVEQGAAYVQAPLFGLAAQIIDDVGAVAHRWNRAATAGVIAFLVRMWPGRPVRCNVVLYVLAVMGGRGWCDETDAQIGEALGKGRSGVSMHLHRARAEGILASVPNGRQRARRKLIPGPVLLHAIELSSGTSATSRGGTSATSRGGTPKRREIEIVSKSVESPKPYVAEADGLTDDQRQTNLAKLREARTAVPR